MSESKLKTAAMDSVGELPNLGNLLLQEFGYPHLPDPCFVPEPKEEEKPKTANDPRGIL